MGRADRRAPGQADLQRAPLVPLARRRDRHREGHPLRDPDHRRPAAPAGQDRPGRRPRAVHQARPGRGRLADQAPLLPRQHRADRAGGRARAARPPPRPGGRGGRPLRVLRRPRPGRRRLRPPLRRLVEEGQPPDAGPADAHPRRPAVGRRGRPRRRRLPRDVDLRLARPGRGPGPARAAGPHRLLHVRAGPRRRRRHHRHPAQDPQSGEPGGVLLADPRAAPRAGHRADPLAAEDPPPRAGPRPRPGPRDPGRLRRRGPRRPISGTCCRASCSGCAASASPPTRSTWRSSRRTCASPSG